MDDKAGAEDFCTQLIELSLTKLANFEASVWKDVAALTIWLSLTVHLASVNNFLICLCRLMFAVYLHILNFVLL